MRFGSSRLFLRRISLGSTRLMSSHISFPRLNGKSVLITGASSGIGAAAAVLFARSGSNVILSARRADRLADVKAQCEQAHKESGHSDGGRFTVVECDFSKVETIDQAWPELSKDGIDILINNAGGARGRDPVGDLNREDVDFMFDVNVTGAIHISNKVVSEFKKQNSGHVISIGSIAGREPYGGGAIYCATKAALRAFNRSMIFDLVNTPIRVSEVQPGAVETEFSIHRNRGDKSKADAVYEGFTPLVAEDIAEEILWIASRPAHVNVCELFTMPISQAGPITYNRQEKSQK